MSTRVLAVDLGATSGRVVAIDLDRSAPEVEVVHRWANAPVPVDDGSLRWDLPGLLREVEAGLNTAISSGPVASIGVDGWGVDYALFDDAGALVELPYSYRDRRTDGWRTIADRIGMARLYEISGIQLMGINSVFQLAVHDRSALDRAARVVLIPDAVTGHLTGWVGAERSNASTTGLLDAHSGAWSTELIDAIGLRSELLPPLAAAGRQVGDWRGVPVHLIGSHDTASAFLGMPGGGEADTVFVSTGTWVIVGVERPEANTSPEAMAANFSNEAGAFGGVRFLKNVVGFWLLEQCRSQWGDPSVEVLLSEAESAPDDTPTFDARDERFVSPDDMELEILAATGMAPGTLRGVVVRSIIESIAIGVARVVDELADIGAGSASRLAVTGGGARARLLHRMLERHTRLPVAVGSTEATALGNAVAQGTALGTFASLGAGRRWVASAGVIGNHVS